MKREIKFDDFNVVFDNPKHKIDTNREFLINAIKLYALQRNRELKVIFFNGDSEETGASFFYKWSEEKQNTKQ